MRGGSEAIALPATRAAFHLLCGLQSRYMRASLGEAARPCAVVGSASRATASGAFGERADVAPSFETRSSRLGVGGRRRGLSRAAPRLWPIRRSAAAAARASLDPCTLPRLTVERRTIEVNGKAASVFGITAPDGSSGLVLDADQRFLFELLNRSGEATIVHWHGQTPPTDQDGVVETGYEGPIENGGRHVYDFATRPGTHWMHSHLRLQEQALLAAPLIIRSPEDLALDAQEVTVFLHDFSFKDPAELLRSLTEKASWLMTARRPRASRGRRGLRSQALRIEPRGARLCGDAVLNDLEYDAYLANDRTLDDPLVLRTEEAAACGFASSTAQAAPHFGSTLALCKER